MSFVPQVLGPLVRAGWVRSDPGPTGGYRCQVVLSEVSVLQVIEAVDGATDVGRCVVADRPCQAADPCVLHGLGLRHETNWSACCSRRRCRVSNRRSCDDRNARGTHRGRARWLARGGAAERTRRLGVDLGASVARSDRRMVRCRCGVGCRCVHGDLASKPAKLVAVDVRRGRWLDRSRLALRIAIVELVVLGSGVALVLALAGWTWLAPLVIAGPLVAIELSFDIRSRGRRLLPEPVAPPASRRSQHRSCWQQAVVADSPPACGSCWSLVLLGQSRWSVFRSCVCVAVRDRSGRATLRRW